MEERNHGVFYMPQTTKSNVTKPNYQEQFPDLFGMILKNKIFDGILTATTATINECFEALCSLIEEHYPIFSLSALNQSLQYNSEGSYVEYFRVALSHIEKENPALTKKALKSAIDKSLRENGVTGFYASHHLIIPSPVNGANHSYPGLLERMAMAERRLKERLTFLDFRRLFSKYFSNNTYFYGDYDDFLALPDDKKAPPFALLNVSRLKNKPKWVAVFTPQAPGSKKIVFSQSTLTKEERLYFDKSQYDIIERQGTSSAADAYYAVAFLLERGRETKTLAKITPSNPELEKILSLINSASDFETVQMTLTTLMVFSCSFSTDSQDKIIPKKAIPLTASQRASFIRDFFSSTGEEDFSHVPQFYQFLIDTNIISKKTSTITCINFDEKIRGIIEWFKTTNATDYLAILKINTDQITPAQLAIACLITFFRNHAFEKKVSIHVDSSLVFSDSEISYLKKALSENYRLTQIDHGSTPLHAQLLQATAPFLVRNRWLHDHKYHLSLLEPSQMSWKKSAEFFLQHLSFGKPFSDELMDDWKAMGASLFEHVFDMLANDFIRDNLFPKNHHRTIYMPIDNKVFNGLKNYIHKNNEFPFKKWVINIDEIDNDRLIELIQLANENAIESIVITSSDWHKREKSQEFFEKSIAQGKEKKWKTFIRIPALCKVPLDEISRAYQTVIQAIKEQNKPSGSIREAIVASLKAPAKKAVQKLLFQTQTDKALEEKLQRIVSSLPGELPLLSKTSPNIQQEQQQQQQQSTQKESNTQGYKKSRSHPHVTGTKERIVDRNSIVSIFSQWFNTLKTNNPFLYRTLKKEYLRNYPEGEFTAENALLDLFDTLCDFPIVGFSVSAAQLLLDNAHHFLCSGLNLDNLPRGLYFDGKLILFYPDLLSDPNKFTVVLNQKAPQALVLYSDTSIDDCFKKHETMLNPLFGKDAEKPDRPCSLRRALFQLFDQRDESEFFLFIEIMTAMQQKIGDDAFRIFKNHFLSHCDDFSLFATDHYFLLFKEIIDELPQDSLENKLFFNLIQVHMKLVEWEDLRNLWDAFQVFLRTMKTLHITLDEEMFSSFYGINIYILLERIIVICLRTPPEERQYFVKHISQYDLSHSGVYSQVTMHKKEDISNPIFWHEAFQDYNFNAPADNDDYKEFTLRLILENASKKISAEGIDALISVGDYLRKKGIDYPSFKKVFLIAIHVCESSGPNYLSKQWIASEGLGTFLIETFAHTPKNDSEKKMFEQRIFLINLFMRTVPHFPNHNILNLDALLMILKIDDSNGEKLDTILRSTGKNPNAILFIFEMCSLAKRKDDALKKEKANAIAAATTAEKAWKDAKKAIENAKKSIETAKLSVKDSENALLCKNRVGKKEHETALKINKEVKQSVIDSRQQLTSAIATEEAAKITADNAKTAAAEISKKTETLALFFEKESSFLEKIVAEALTTGDEKIQFIRMFSMKYAFRLEKDCVNVTEHKAYQKFLCLLLTNSEDDRSDAYFERIKEINDYFSSEIPLADEDIIYEPNQLMMIHRVFSKKENFSLTYAKFCEDFKKILTSPGIKKSEKNNLQPPAIKKIDKHLCERCITADHAIFSQREMIASLLSHFIVKHNDESIGETLEPFFFLLNRIAEKSEGDLIDFCLAIEEKIKDKTPAHQLEFLHGVLSIFVENPIKNTFPLFILPILFEEINQLTSDTQKEKSTLSDPVKIALNMILKNDFFRITEKKQLIKLILRLDYWSDATHSQDIENLFTLLSHYKKNNASQEAVLFLLEKCKTYDDYKKIFPYCHQAIADDTPPDIISLHWDETNRLCLEQLLKENASSELLTIFNQIKAHENGAYLLHIVAWSTLCTDYKSQVLQEADRKKLPKLLLQLEKLPRESLTLIASYCTPLQSVRGDTLRWILKNNLDDSSRKYALDKNTNPYSPEHRIVHDADFNRIMNEISYTQNNETKQLTAAEKVMLASMRAKLIESAKKISDLKLAELKKLFFDLQEKQAPRIKGDPRSNSDYHGQLMDARIDQFAVLFEIMRGTIHVYPNLIQQLSLLIGEILDSHCRIITLATGEGKSILIALNAALSAAKGNYVDICTTNLTLAKRDAKNFSKFYSALGFPTAVVTASSSAQEDALRVRYSTPGDISLLKTANLFETGKTTNERPFVLILDEADSALSSSIPHRYSISFTEGENRYDAEEFYHVVYDFYLKEIDEKKIKSITKNLLNAFSKKLCEYANNQENRLRFIASFQLSDFLQWLYAAHSAHSLEKDKHFTVRHEATDLADSKNEKAYVIYPLSPEDNNLLNATFSDGVHQLLATRISRENNKNGISGRVITPKFTQVASSRFFTQQLLQDYSIVIGLTATIEKGAPTPNNTITISMPTNKPDQRTWHKSKIFEDNDARLNFLIDLVLEKLKQKKSILISCANDNETRRLKKIFSENPRLLDHADKFFSHTNDSDISPEKLLEKKREKEQLHNGQKTIGTVLFSACFDRGANVEVDAVVILDKSTESARLQKGGRTARNGEQGDVYECYVKEEVRGLVRAIYEKAKNCLSSEEDEKIKNFITPDHNPENSDFCFNLHLVSALIAHYNLVSHQEENKYQQLLSQFSDWAVNFISTAEPSEKTKYTITLIQLQKSIQKEWDSLKNGAPEIDKILTIKSKIEVFAKELSPTKLFTFKAEKEKEPFAQRRIVSTDQSKEISPAVTNLMLFYLAHAPFAGPLYYLNTLRLFAAQAETTIPDLDRNSLIPFFEALKKTPTNEPSTDESLFSALRSKLESIPPGDLLAANLSSNENCRKFMEMLGRSDFTFRELFLKNFYLSLNAYNITERIKQAILLLQYLEQFYKDNTPKELIKYADHLLTLLCSPNHNWILHRLDQLSILTPIEHLLSLAAFIREITEIQSSESNNLSGDLLKSLIDLSTVSTNDRVQRQLTELSAVLTHKELTTIIPIFCAVEIGTIRAGNEELIHAIHHLFTLITNPSKQHYKPYFLEIWRSLATHIQSSTTPLENISGVIHFCLTHNGKLVFTLLKTLLNPDYLSFLTPEELKLMISELHPGPEKQVEKIQRVGLFLEHNSADMWPGNACKVTPPTQLNRFS